MVSNLSPSPALSSVEIEAVLRARERRAKTAIGRLEHIDDAGEAVAREQRAVKPALRRASRMHALDHGAVLRRHQAGRLGACDAERMHRLLGGKSQAARGAGGRRVNAHGRAGMPALADMLLPHAPSDARADFVARDRGGEEVASAKVGMALRDRDQRRQRDGAHMQHALAVNVVELEPLHLRAVDQRRMRRRETKRRAPDRRGAGGVQAFERRPQDAAPFELRAVDARSRANRGSAA